MAQAGVRAGAGAGCRRRGPELELPVASQAGSGEGWIGDRAACPQLTAAAYAAKGYPHGERASVYEDTVFARQVGHMECKDVDTKVPGFALSRLPVQRPGRPADQAKGGEAFFEPGIGHVAIVSIEHAPGVRARRQVHTLGRPT